VLGQGPVYNLVAVYALEPHRSNETLLHQWINVDFF